MDISSPSLSSTPLYFALLIGIDAYPKDRKPLKGCVNDVCKIEKHLEKIDKIKVHTLKAIADQDTASSEPTGRLRPTLTNVTDAIKSIVSDATEANKGGFVYIHFSGHGTAMRPPVPTGPTRMYSNLSTGDLALNLLADDGISIEYLRGYKLAFLVQNLIDANLIVTLVLDCCFSGSVTRGDAVRCLDYDSQIDAAHPPNLNHDIIPRDNRSKHSSSRNASMWSNWIVNQGRCTTITACGPTEVAKEIRIGGRIHGALSYYLMDNFEKLRCIGGKQQTIYQALYTRFQNAQIPQSPMLFGNQNLNFLGRPNPDIGAATFSVIKSKSGGYKIRAGQAHGICEGDSFAIREIVPRGTGSVSVLQGVSVTTKVISVGSLVSNLDLSETYFASDMSLCATPITRLSLRRFPVLLDLGESFSDDWAKVWSEQQSLQIHNSREGNRNIQCSFTVAMPEHGSCEIRGENDSKLLYLPGLSAQSDKDATLILALVEHMARFEMVRSLENTPLTNPQSKFRGSFSVQLITPAGPRNPGCSQTSQNQAMCAHPECRIEVEEGTKLDLVVKNVSKKKEEKEDGHAFCMHVYAMGSSWEIENLYNGYEVIPPLGSNESDQFSKGTKGPWKKAIKMNIPQHTKEKGQTYCDDVFKIFLTSQPTALELELPDIHELMLKGDDRDQKREVAGFSPVEDWVALSFCIRTTRK